ncbi:MAG: phosphatidate cytidylyltransferase [Chloroflexota bacterium]|nr:phosphatidate cytidylyltransferase [Chloroflexota bacterium]
MRGLKVRAVSGVLLLAGVLLAIWLRGPLLMLVVGVAAALAAHEFFGIVRRAGYAPLYTAGVPLALLLGMRAYLGGDIFSGTPSVISGTATESVVLVLVLLLVLARQGFGWARATTAGVNIDQGGVPRSPYLAWADIGFTLGGALYTGGLIGYAPLLAALPVTATSAGGTYWLLLVLLGTAACDTGAYLVGSTLGRHKMIPHISPGKTWEGLVGGVAGAVIAATSLSGLLKISLGEAVALGLLICAAAVSGDLCESLLKRAAGVKDSGHLIPGHGGILDRIDSILFVLLAVYWFVQVHG